MLRRRRLSALLALPRSLLALLSLLTLLHPLSLLLASRLASLLLAGLSLLTRSRGLLSATELSRILQTLHGVVEDLGYALICEHLVHRESLPRRHLFDVRLVPIPVGILLPVPLLEALCLVALQDLPDLLLERADCLLELSLDNPTDSLTRIVPELVLGGKIRLGLLLPRLLLTGLLVLPSRQLAELSALFTDRVLRSLSLARLGVLLRGTVPAPALLVRVLTAVRLILSVRHRPSFPHD